MYTVTMIVSFILFLGMSCIGALRFIVEKQPDALREHELEEAKFALDTYYNASLATKFKMVLGIGGYVLSEGVHKLINFERKKKNGK